MQNVMIDLETLDVRPSAVILSIAAIRFDPLVPGSFGEDFEIHIDLDSSLQSGRTVSGSTILWWLDQDSEARRAILDSPKVGFLEALTSLSKFLKPNDRIWGNGASFDNVILSDAYRSCQIETPWPYWSDMCYRTLKNMYPNVKGPLFTGTKHNALDDAKHQAARLQHIFEYAGLGHQAK